MRGTENKYLLEDGLDEVEFLQRTGWLDSQGGGQRQGRTVRKEREKKVNKKYKNQG